MRFKSKLWAAVAAVSLASAGAVASADENARNLDELFVWLASGEQAFINDAPRVIGFTDQSIGVYAAHLAATWQDDTLRGYLSERLAPVARFEADGSVDIGSFEDVIALMPLALSAKGDYGVLRLLPSQKGTYARALHSAFRVEAEKGVEACLAANRTDFGARREDLYAAARHKFTLMKNMHPKVLHAYLQVQRAAAREELGTSEAAVILSQAELDQAFSHIDPVLDRLAADHPNAQKINDFWYNDLEDKVTECDVYRLDWQVLDELEDEALGLASHYYIELFLGVH